MKTDQLLAKYLYEYKTLNLPSIGTFTLDPGVVIPEDAEKQKTPLSGISFQKKSERVLDESLIEFVKTHTGKITPLATSDIESYISLCTQLLNIGNPLYIDGIGTLIKNREGDYIFTPGVFNSQKLVEPTLIKENTEQTRRSAFDEAYNRQEPTSAKLKGVLLLLLGALTIGLISWGAYYLYQRGQNKQESSLTNTNIDTLAAPTIDSTLPTRIDTSAQMANQPNTSSSAYRYVLESTADSKRAIKRYTQLIGLGATVLVDSTEPGIYRICMDLPAVPADSARVKDSLTKQFGKAVTLTRLDNRQ